MFYVKCFLYGKPVTVENYKTKRSAENRKKKALESGCYEDVTITHDNDSKNVFEHGLKVQ